MSTDTLKPVQAETRPMRDLSFEERRQILIELQTENSRVVRERHRIDNQVLSHIRYHHGKSAAKSKGDYHNDLLAGYESPELAKMKELKMSGKNSAEVATAMNIPLERVNSVWGDIKP